MNFFSHNNKEAQKPVDSGMLALIKNDLRGWPILTETNPNPSNILDKLVKLRFYDSRGFFDLFIATNPKDPTSLILRVFNFKSSLIFKLFLKKQTRKLNEFNKTYKW